MFLKGAPRTTIAPICNTRRWGAQTFTASLISSGATTTPLPQALTINSLFCLEIGTLIAIVNIVYEIPNTISNSTSHQRGLYEKNPAFAVALSAVLSTSFIATAQADKLDDIIGSGKLRCAVTLDFPPMGFRDEGNNPAGFDVDYCRDLAKKSSEWRPKS